MEKINIGVTSLVNSYRIFDKQFWLDYKTLEKLHPRFDEIKIALLRAKRADNYLSEVDEVQFQTERALLDQEWKQKSQEARQAGTAMHEQLHNMLVTDLVGCKQCFGIPTDLYQVMQKEKFENSDGLFPEFKMEIDLDDEYKLVGIADLIIKSGNKVRIIDYKTGDKIEQHAYFDMSKGKKKHLKFPLCSLEDCSLVQYQLQVSLYAWMIKQICPDMTIESLEIYHIKDGKLKKIYPVEFLEKEVETLIKWHLKALKLKKATDACKLIEY